MNTSQLLSTVFYDPTNKEDHQIIVDEVFLANGGRGVKYHIEEFLEKDERSDFWDPESIFISQDPTSSENFLSKYKIKA